MTESTQTPAATDEVGRRIRIRTPGSASVPPTNGAARRPAATEAVFDVRNLSVSYGPKRAVDDVTMKIHRNLVTALIGPSGCGKTTFLRCLNRMNDSIPGFGIEGQLLYHGHDVYGP